eukprot:7875418-Lingulodinium_polyedra.AAC.1
MSDLGLAGICASRAKPPEGLLPTDLSLDTVEDLMGSADKQKAEASSCGCGCGWRGVLSSSVY